MKNPLLTSLQHSIHRLDGLGRNGAPFYVEEYARCSDEVSRLTNELYLSSLQGDTPEEEAAICLALLEGYRASHACLGDTHRRADSLLARSYRILDMLPASSLKLRLLHACYAESGDESLCEEIDELRALV